MSKQDTPIGEPISLEELAQLKATHKKQAYQKVAVYRPQIESVANGKVPGLIFRGSTEGRLQACRTAIRDTGNKGTVRARTVIRTSDGAITWILEKAE